MFDATDAATRLAKALADRYTIERQIGAGGMATVYLARDLRHDRPVALKLLSPELGAVLGPERFLSEIKVTANLHHPNLLPLFDSGEAEGQLYYVMPYVAGETLRARLQRERQLPVEEAIHITTGVASALDYAHRHGVIHRDLKPENILLHDDQPLVADFGIALAVSKAGGERVTQSGLSLGTPQYMSPEQATGDRVIDARTDVYSLGAVLYEMLAGDPPHTGSTAQAIIARLLTERPRSVRGIRPAVPQHVEAAIQKALEKLPADRFATARQFAEALTHPGSIQLTSAAASESAAGGRPLERSRTSRFAPTLVVIAGVIALAASGVAFWQWRERQHAGTDTPVRFSVPMPTGEEFVRTDMVGAAIAPGGETIVYVTSSDGKSRLNLRSLAELEGRPLSGTEGAAGPFFSPDGKWLGFFSGTKLVRMPVAGGAPSLITETVRPDNVAWLPDNTILIPTSVFTGGRSGLSVIPAGGGRPRAVFRSDSSRGENHATPIVLSDGETVLFNSNGPSGYDDDHLAIGSLKTGKYAALDIIANRAVGLLDGLLLYLREDGALMAVPVDIGGQRATGDPFPLLEGVADGWHASISANGSLLYVQGEAASTLVLADEAGVLKPLFSEVRQYSSPRFSPDGRRIVITIGFGQSDVWLANVSSGTMTRLTDGAADHPEWSPDGRRVVFRSRKAGQASFLWAPADGSEAAERMPIRIAAGEAQGVVIAPNGRTALYRITSKRRGDLYYSAIGGNDDPHPFVTGAADEITPRFSPDGQWLAYTSDDSGTREVYVRPFPGPGGRVQISTAGGQEPMWSRDGGTLFYRDVNGVIAVNVNTSTTFEIRGRSTRLRGNFASIDRHANYDVSPDGKQLLMLQPAGQQSRMVWVVDWISELRARLAAEKR